MSVNKVDAAGGRLTLHGDYVIHHQKDVEFHLEGDRLPSNMKGSYKGDMFITNLRLIFINGSTSSSGYKSFEMDFQHIRNLEVKQPIFGANHLKGYVIAQPDGGWEGNANFFISFPKGGAIDFAEKFQRAVKDSLRQRQNPPPQPMYNPMGMPPPPGGYYPQQQPGFYAYQPGMPPQGGSQTYAPMTGQAPPPYNPTDGQQYQSQHQTTANSKAQEAYMNGNTAYVPNEAPPPYNPSYDSNAKKDQ